MSGRSSRCAQLSQPSCYFHCVPGRHQKEQHRGAFYLFFTVFSDLNVCQIYFHTHWLNNIQTCPLLLVATIPPSCLLQSVLPLSVLKIIFSIINSFHHCPTCIRKTFWRNTTRLCLTQQSATSWHCVWICMRVGWRWVMERERWSWFS